MPKVITFTCFILVGLLFLYGLSSRTNWHHDRATDPYKVMESLHVMTPSISKITPIATHNPDSTKWDCYGYRVFFIGPFNTVITDPLERKCKRWWNNWYRIDHQSAVEYVHTSARQWSSDIYYSVVRIVDDIPDTSYDTAYIEYYVNKKEARIVTVRYSSLLLGLFIALVITTKLLKR